MKKCIFGKNFEFIACKEWANELDDSLSLYLDSDSEVMDVRVDIVDEPAFPETKSSNPKIFKRSLNGFQANFGSTIVSWSRESEDNLLKVMVVVKDPFHNAILGFLKRIRSMEFSTKTEWFEQVVHELVLVPTAHFFSDLAVVHAACIGNEEGCFLFTGTGGVGKSSAMLSVAGAEKVAFISDDIAILDKNGVVYGNLAWPKVYGYNCEGNHFSRTLLKGRSVVDKLHFLIKNRLNPSKVRRKIRPNLLFRKCFPGGTRLRGVFFLFKEQCDQIAVSEFPAGEAARASVSVMSAEYQIFYKFVEWEEYNANLTGSAAFISMDEVRTNWIEIFESAFPGIVKKIAIPIDVDHRVYQEEIGALIKKSLNV